MKKRWMSVMLVSILIASALMLGACSGGQDAQASGAASPTESAAPASASEPAENASEGTSQNTAVGLTSFTTLDFDGNTVTQEIFADYDLTMVNIWATFCSPCISEMPQLGELKAEYADKGVNIVGIVVDVQESDGSISQDMVATAKDIVAQTGAAYTHLLPSDSLNSALLAGVSAVPTTVFVDSKGNIVKDGVFVGAHEKADWQTIINGLLAQK